MIDGSEKRNRQLAFELQNFHVCDKHSKLMPHSHQSLNTFKSCLFKHGLKLFSSQKLLTDLWPLQIMCKLQRMLKFI